MPLSGCIQRRIIIPPLVIFVFFDFSPFQTSSLFLPCMEHIKHGGVSGAGGFVQPQTHFSVNLSDFQPVHILQSKEGVHQDRGRLSISGTSIARGLTSKIVSHFFDEVAFGCSGFGFVLRYTDVGGLFRESRAFHRAVSVSCLFRLRKKRMRLPIAIIKPPLQSFLVQAISV